MAIIVPFSMWTHWSERSKRPERDSPGIYLLGRFEEEVPKTVDTTDVRILLVAETHNQSLQVRWAQFHRSAFLAADGHSGGRTFYKLFNNGLDSTVPSWLFVSAVAVPSDQDVTSYTRSIKHQLLTRYKDQHGLLPVCNTNGPADAVASNVPATISLPMETDSDSLTTKAPRDFSPWILWSDRKSLDGGSFAGVYALARFVTSPSQNEILDEQVVYIGETCENSLLGRLGQFNRSAFQGKDGHSGGRTYRARFSDDGDHLYVSACPLRQLSEPHRSAFIRWLERQLLWDYVKRWGHRPVCNSK